MKTRIALLSALMASVPPTFSAELNNLFTDGAVLQRGMTLPIWGEGTNGEKITVKLLGQTATTTVANKQWMVKLKPLKAGGPFDLEINADNTLRRKVWVGEVWVASGQSNMQFDLRSSTNGVADVAAATIPGLHLFNTPRLPSGVPQKNADSKWTDCSPSTAGSFSAVAFYFGRELLKSLNVPIGLIHSSWGGTPAQSWATRESLLAHPDLAYYVRESDDAIKSYPQRMEAYRTQLAAYEKAKSEGATTDKAPQEPIDLRHNPYRAAGLYNGMIAPLVPYAIRGAIWYQGESNAGRAFEYRELFPVMIQSWRDSWKEGNFPFYFAQLAPFKPIVTTPQESAWAELREAQLLTARTVPNTGMAVITDYGNPVDIHPTDKEPVGARLALLALHKTYGKKVVSSGPGYKSMKINGNSIILKFDNVDGGLMSKKVVLPGTPNNQKANGTDSVLTGWTIAGDDKKFVNAEALIDGNTVVVSSPAVANPVAVRYGWADCPVVNLFNAAGLPASPFRTDNWPITTGPTAP